MATNENSIEIKTRPTASEIEDYVNWLYTQFKFSAKKNNIINKDAFAKGVIGYLNLKNEAEISNPILSIADFTLSSNKYRLWVLDMKNKKVLYHTYVAHGMGTGDEFATKFSNTDNSHQSSLGFYITQDIYIGEHGNSLRLAGMDHGFNDAALDRGIVVHGAKYVCKEWIEGNQKLGRSWGCPAVTEKIAEPLINTIKNGSCYFAYYPQKDFFKKSYWLNHSIVKLPEDYTKTLPKLFTPMSVKMNTSLEKNKYQRNTSDCDTTCVTFKP